MIVSVLLFTHNLIVSFLNPYIRLNTTSPEVGNVSSKSNEIRARRKAVLAIKTVCTYYLPTEQINNE